MRRSRTLMMIAVLAVLPFAGCTKGTECDRCETDEDCNDGLVCSTFSDDSKRCGSGFGDTTCRVR